MPLLVELRHPSQGNLRCMARDISEGGVFVHVTAPQLRVGAKLKLTLLNTLGVEPQPTPTVDMEVVRIDPEGLGLAFLNNTGRHLWQSVERWRTELAIGRDYFQVHLNALVINDANALLLVQQHGRWMFPATFLQVGRDWQTEVREFLTRDFGIAAREFGPIVRMDSLTEAEVPEAAALNLYVEIRAATADCRLATTSRYRSPRWVDQRRTVEEATFLSETARRLAADTLTRLIREQAGTPP